MICISNPLSRLVVADGPAPVNPATAVDCASIAAMVSALNRWVCAINAPDTTRCVSSG